MKNRKVLNIWISVLFVALFLVLSVFLVQNVKSNKNEVFVSGKVAVVSQQTLIPNTYHITLTGTFENNTNIDLFHVSIKVIVKVDGMRYSKTYTVDDITILANGVFELDQLYESNIGYNSVQSVSYITATRTRYVSILNPQSQQKARNGIMISLMFVLLGASIVVESLRIKQNRRLALQKKQFIESNLKTRAMKLRLKADESNAEYINNQDKINYEPPTQKAKPQKASVCTYCKMKGEPGDKICKFCGAIYKDKNWFFS